MLNDSVNQLWSRLEERYADGAGCGCGSEGVPEEALTESSLTEEDVLMYLQGEIEFDELTAKVEADIDHDSVNDIDSLAAELERVHVSE